MFKAYSETQRPSVFVLSVERADLIGERRGIEDEKALRTLVADLERPRHVDELRQWLTA
jgi:hypothetical protein